MKLQAVLRVYSLHTPTLKSQCRGDFSYRTTRTPFHCDSQCINIFWVRQQEDEYRPIVMADEAILDEAESTKLLGMYLDRGLTWSDHIDRVCSKVASGIYVLRNLANFYSLGVLKTAYFGIVHSHLTYVLRL
ncbi:hypothetical protein J6590_087484 [Homalodisca vitripennis]|nr:hypothetical protein J6590_087484 [Homalodisca vitripennis]